MGENSSEEEGRPFDRTVISNGAAAQFSSYINKSICMYEETQSGQHLYGGVSVMVWSRQHMSTVCRGNLCT